MQTLTLGDEAANWLLLWVNLGFSLAFGAVAFGLFCFRGARRADFRESLPTVSKPVGGALATVVAGLMLWALGIGHWSVFYEASVADDAFSVTYRLPEDTIRVSCDDVRTLEVVTARERFRRITRRGWRVVIYTHQHLRLRSALIRDEDEAHDVAAAFCPDRDDLRAPSNDDL